MSYRNSQNDSKNHSGTSGGIGFCGLLTIVFIALKLCHVIEWSWLWVLAPLWIPFAIVIVVLIIIAIVMIIGAMLDK